MIVGLVFFEYMPKREISVMKTSINYFEQGYESYERMLHVFKSNLIQNNIPLSYFFNAGTIISKDNFDHQEYFSDTLFIFIDDSYPPNNSCIALKESLYMCICADDPDKEKEYAKKLYHEMKQQGYTLDGDYLCELLTQFPFSNHGSPIKYKIQIPLSKNKKLVFFLFIC